MSETNPVPIGVVVCPSGVLWRSEPAFDQTIPENGLVARERVWGTVVTPVKGKRKDKKIEGYLLVPGRGYIPLSDRDGAAVMTKVCHQDGVCTEHM